MTVLLAAMLWCCGYVRVEEPKARFEEEDFGTPLADYAVHAVEGVRRKSLAVLCSPEKFGFGATRSGRTVSKLRGKTTSKTPDGKHSAWSIADATTVKVRCGPNYSKCGGKVNSAPALYAPTGIDVVSGPRKIGPVCPDCYELPEGAATWNKSMGVPRCLLVTMQFPFEEGPKLFGEHPADDHGVTMVGCFIAQPDILAAAGETDPQGPMSAALRLLRRFVAKGNMEPEGAGAKSSLSFKMIGHVVGLEKLSLPALLRPTVEKYNGKPVLMSAFGVMTKDPNLEWMELAFDVRKMSWPTRSMLVKLAEQLRTVSVQFYFVLQGTADSELPETILGSFTMHNIDLLEGVWFDPLERSD